MSFDLSPSAFLSSAEFFLKWSEENHEGWRKMKEEEKDPFKMVLVHRFRKEVKVENKELLERLSAPDHKADDNEAASDEVKSSQYLIEVHLVYDVSFRVPGTLLIVADEQGRSIVTSTELLHILQLPSNGLETSVSQISHPILGLPVWKLHPCQTAAVIQTVAEGLGKEQMEEEKFMVLYWSLYRKVIGV